jgi:hypothetical protein
LLFPLFGFKESYGIINYLKSKGVQMARKKTVTEVLVQNTTPEEKLHGKGKYKVMYGAQNEVAYFNKQSEIHEFFNEMGQKIRIVRPESEKRKRTKKSEKSRNTVNTKPTTSAKPKGKYSKVITIHGIEFVYDEEDGRYYDKKQYEKGRKVIDPFEK